MNNISTITENDVQELIERTIGLKLDSEVQDRVIATILNCYKESYTIFRTYNDVKTVLENWTLEKTNKADED